MAEFVRHPGLIKSIGALLAYWITLVAVAFLNLLPEVVFAMLLIAGIPLLLLAGIQVWLSGSVRARELANHDDLTGLGNRRAFVSLARSLVRRSRPGSLSLVLIDVDGLKPINDNCGHQAGDELLVEIAKHLASVSDAVFRVGGDEFAILVSRTEGQSVTGLLESLKPRMHHFRAYDHDHQIQFSYGFAAHRPDEDFEDVYRRADVRLREFKEKLYASGQLSERRSRRTDSARVDNDTPEREVAQEAPPRVVSIFSRRGHKEPDHGIKRATRD